MPVAVVDPNHYTLFSLKSAPANPDVEGDEDGFVMLRPLPYGLLLERNDKTMKMSMKSIRPQDRKRKGGEVEMPDVDLKTMNQIGSEFDFANCIGDHNLLNANGEKLDFGNPLTFKVLDPRIAQEIQGYIDELNEPEDAESARGFYQACYVVASERAELALELGGFEYTDPKTGDRLFVSRHIVVEASYWTQIASVCDRLKCLPEMGSVFEQRPYVMNKMLAALRALDKAADDEMKRETAKVKTQ